MKHKVLLIIYALLNSGLLLAQEKKPIQLCLPAAEERWWVGIINHGSSMPISAGYKANLNGNIYGNQAQPLILSNKGRLVWSTDPFEIEYQEKTKSLVLTKDTGDFLLVQAGTTLSDAYHYASKHFFPPSGSKPDESLFLNPQYNTWIELQYNQNQKDVLNYAKAISDHGFPPGVIMIDDNWQEDYGTWKFHAGRFPNPVQMIDSLHSRGFKVMVWVCPFVSADSETGRLLQKNNLLLKDKEGNPKAIYWWNGISTVLDFTNADAVDWFKKQLQYLMTTYHIDGFKFDAGDPEFYINGISKEPASPNRHTELYSGIGLDFPLNEYRATWKMGGNPLAQRLRDKEHSWKDLQQLVPDILLQGIMGYPFTCPDLIGGGEIQSFLELTAINQDLIVRSAQCQALMPMMQFSVAPWRVLDSIHLKAVKKAVALRLAYTPEIIHLANNAAITGEPIVRMMEYEFPHQGFESVNDQFMLGDSILVAPITDSIHSRVVQIPKGTWKDMVYSGKLIHGPKVIKMEAALDELPYFIKVSE